MLKLKKRHSTAVIPGDLGYFRNHIGHYKKMLDLMRSKQAQVALISMRRKSIQDSNVLNYQNEYNRLRGVVENTNPGLHGDTLDSIRDRQRQLVQLGAMATQANHIV